MQKEILIELTTLCTAHCEVCKRNMDIDIKKYLNKQIDTKTLLNFLKHQDKSTDIRLTGILGEPLLHKDIDIILDFFISNNIPLRIDTNFEVVNSSTIKKIKELLFSDLLNLWVAIDSMDFVKHNIYRGTNLKKILYNVNALSYKGNNIHVRTILFKHNEGCIENIKGFCQTNNYIHELTSSCLYTDNLQKSEVFETKHTLNECILSWHVTVDGFIIPCCYAFDDLKMNRNIKDSMLLLKNIHVLNIKNTKNIWDVLDRTFRC